MKCCFSCFSISKKLIVVLWTIFAVVTVIAICSSTSLQNLPVFFSQPGWDSLIPASGFALSFWIMPSIVAAGFFIHSFLFLLGKLCGVGSNSGTLRFHAGMTAAGTILLSFQMVYLAILISYFCNQLDAVAISAKLAMACPNSLNVAIAFSAISAVSGLVFFLAFCAWSLNTLFDGSNDSYMPPEREAPRPAIDARPKPLETSTTTANLHKTGIPISHSV